MLEAYDDSFRNMAEGEVVKGTVLKVTEAAVVVDVGYKSEGLIPIHEFLDENGNVTVQAGDTVDVLLERTEDREGHIVLSREKAEKMKIWDEVEKAYADRKVVIGRVIERKHVVSHVHVPVVVDPLGQDGRGMELEGGRYRHGENLSDE